MAKKKQPNRASQRQQQINDMVLAARKERESNKDLIAAVRQDPGMAEDLKRLLCQDLKRVSEVPREILGPSSSRARYRQLGNYSADLATFLFGMWAEFQRQAGIFPSLATKTVERNISKTARAQIVAKYADKNVKPWDGAYDMLPTTGRVRLLIGSDFHSHFCNPFALRVWHEVMAEAQPDGIRINGDLVDFPSLSTHRQLPGHFPLSVQDEIDWAVEEVLRPARRICPKADIKFLLGNHDMRLVYALADKSPIFASLRSFHFAEQFKLDELEIGLVARSSFLNPSARHRVNDIAQNWETIAGMFTVVHGFLTGKDSPRKHLARFMTHGTNGHLHDRQVVSGGSLATGVLHWFQTPCMAHPEAVAAGYITGPADYQGWSCGFMLVDLYPQTGHVHAEFIDVGPEIATWRDRVWRIDQDERDQIQEMLEV